MEGATSISTILLVDVDVGSFPSNIYLPTLWAKHTKTTVREAPSLGNPSCSKLYFSALSLAVVVVGDATTRIVSHAGSLTLPVHWWASASSCFLSSLLITRCHWIHTAAACYFCMCIYTSICLIYIQTVNHAYSLKYVSSLFIYQVQIYALHLCVPSAHRYLSRAHWSSTEYSIACTALKAEAFGLYVWMLLPPSAKP